MSRKRDDDAQRGRDPLRVLQDDIDASDARRRKLPPTNPAEWLSKVMIAEHASAEDVAERTNTLTAGVIRRLIAGKRDFTTAICEELTPWLGSRAKAFLGICRNYAYFQEHHERAPRARLQDTPEARDTARWYADYRRGAKSTPEPV